MQHNLNVWYIYPMDVLKYLLCNMAAGRRNPLQTNRPELFRGEIVLSPERVFNPCFLPRFEVLVYARYKNHMKTEKMQVIICIEHVYRF